MEKTVKRRTPRKIKIGYSDFKVIPRSKHWARRHKAFGTCDPSQSKIQYDQTQNPKELPNTILHEVLHGIIYIFDIEFKNLKEEENVVRKLANGLHTVFRDNPKFAEWLWQQCNIDSDENDDE